MTPFMILFIVADVLVTLAFMAFLYRRLRAFRDDGPGLPLAKLTVKTLRALAEFAKQQHERIGNNVRARWSGSPEQLPAVITGLLDELERDAKAQDLPLDRDVLKAMLATSLRTHRIGQRNELSEAFRKVA